MDQSSLSHPEWVNGRRLWLDATMRDLIHKLHHGDPVIGWEGDERLGVYWDEPNERWEIWRLEDDGQYRLVCRSPRRSVFDERVLWDLCRWDRQRRRTSLADETIEHNQRLKRERTAETDLYMTEEVVPRLRHAILKE